MNDKVIKNTNNSTYLFQGNKFVEYVDVKKLKDELVSKTSIDKVEIEGLSLPQVFEYINTEKTENVNDLKEIFFGNIMYSHLKHVFIDQFFSKPKFSDFKKEINSLIKKFNYKDAIPSALTPYMSDTGFYLMDQLGISTPRTRFIAGIDHEVDGEKLLKTRMLFVEVVPVKTGSEYFIAGIDIDFTQGAYLIMIKNKLGIGKLEGDDTQNLNRTVISLYNFVKKEIVIPLLASIDKIDTKKDRLNMYNLCKGLDAKLLEDIRKDVNSKTNETLKTSIKSLLSDLSLEEKKLKKFEKEKLTEKVESLLIATYISKRFKPIELVRLAKEKKLLGYPTKVKFSSTRASKSATQSSSAKIPVSSSDMFHSLYINFKDARELEQWAISWFTDYEFLDKKDIDVIQTTIYSKSSHFEVLFKPTRSLEKETIYHVVRNIIQYRFADN